MIIPISMCFAYQANTNPDGSIPPMVAAVDGTSDQVWTLPQNRTPPWRFNQAKAIAIAAEVKSRRHIVSEHWLKGFPGWVQAPMSGSPDSMGLSGESTSEPSAPRT